MARIYSARFVDLYNFSGLYTYTNDTGDQLVIRCVTAYYGGLAQRTFKLSGPSGAGWLWAELGPLTQPLAVWTDVRLNILNEESFYLTTDDGMDLSVNGYALTPP